MASSVLPNIEAQGCVCVVGIILNVSVRQQGHADEWFQFLNFEAGPVYVTESTQLSHAACVHVQPFISCLRYQFWFVGHLCSFHS